MCLFKKFIRQSNYNTIVRGWKTTTKARCRKKEETTNQKVRRAVKSAFAETARRTIAQWIVMKKFGFTLRHEYTPSPSYNWFFLLFQFYPIRNVSLFSNCAQYWFNRNKHSATIHNNLSSKLAHFFSLFRLLSLTFVLHK